MPPQNLENSVRPHRRESDIQMGLLVGFTRKVGVIDNGNVENQVFQFSDTVSGRVMPYTIIRALTRSCLAALSILAHCSTLCH